MPSADKQRLGDEVLSRYLLGSLPPEEAERLHELSIVDDEFALRLDAVENDLVDAYARGELSKDALEQFQKFYLSSPRRLEKVEFARTFLRLGEKAATAEAAATMRPATPSVKSGDQATSPGRSLRRWFTIPRLDLQWGFAAAAMALLLAGSYFFVENQRLRQEATEARNQQIALSQHTQDLELQLREQRSASDGMRNELRSLRESSSASHVLGTIAVLLSAPTRGVAQVPTVSVPPGTNQVALRLQLEPNDFLVYAATLKDSATGQILWKAGKLRAKPEGANKIVSFNFPARLLTHQSYLVDLEGMPNHGPAELVAGYAFRVVLK